MQPLQMRQIDEDEMKWYYNAQSLQMTRIDEEYTVTLDETNQ